MKRILTTIVSVALCVGVSAPALAHSDGELAEWMTAWERRDETALSVPEIPEGEIFGAIADDLWMDLLIDMRERHPCREVLGQRCAVRQASADSSDQVAWVDPVRQSWGGNVEEWRPLVAGFFPADMVETAMCIMRFESGGNPNAKNRSSTAAGLFQFLKSTWDNMVPRDVTGGSYSSGQVFVPEANVRSAAWLAINVGWSQWSPYKRGECRGL